MLPPSVLITRTALVVSLVASVRIAHAFSVAGRTPALIASPQILSRMPPPRFRSKPLLSTTSDADFIDTLYDVAILGTGPASCSLAALLSASPSSPRVVVLSKEADKSWVPNYGTWTEEWEALDKIYSSQGVPGLMEKGVDTRWSDTDCFFGEDDGGTVQTQPEGNGRRALGREYIRVSRDGLKKIFFGDKDEDRKFDVVRENVDGSVINTNVFEPAGSVTFGADYTELTLSESKRKLRAKIVVDGTGAETSFTIRDGRENEGYQIAYGVECRVEGSGVTDKFVGDYDRSKMVCGKDSNLNL